MQSDNMAVQIARNAYLTEQKKRSRQTALEIAFELADGAHFTDRLCEKEQVMQIHRTLHTLKEPYREVFTLRVLGNLSYREIAGDLLQNRRLGKGHLLSGKGNIDTENGGRT